TSMGSSAALRAALPPLGAARLLVRGAIEEGRAAGHVSLADPGGDEALRVLALPLIVLPVARDRLADELRSLGALWPGLAGEPRRAGRAAAAAPAAAGALTDPR